jgi:hypothetical protein
LVSGRAATVREAGISAVGEAYGEKGIPVDDFVHHIWILPKVERGPA